MTETREEYAERKLDEIIDEIIELVQEPVNDVNRDALRRFLGDEYNFKRGQPMKTEQRLVDGIELSDEHAEKYYAMARMRDTVRNVTDSATRAAMESFRGNASKHDLRKALEEIKDWAYDEELARHCAVQEIWEELVEAHGLVIEPLAHQLTIWEVAAGKPRVFYEKIVMDASEKRFDGFEVEEPGDYYENRPTSR